MGKKMKKTIFVFMLMTLLSGCGGQTPAQIGDMPVQNQDALSGSKSAEPEGSDFGESGSGASDCAVSQFGSSVDASLDSGTRGEGGASPKGNARTDTGSEPTAYHIDEEYAEEDNILPISESAAAEGISYKIENVEYTESFGDRDRERLMLFSPEVKTDGQGTLQGENKYIFLTITFTNTTDKAQEIYRTSNGISVLGASLNIVDWANDVCYYDKDWEKGTVSQKHHWVLEPGESVTSEVGWVIEGCGSILAADDMLGSRMGSQGPYVLYYRAGDYFIDLGVEVE